MIEEFKEETATAPSSAQVGAPEQIIVKPQIVKINKSSLDVGDSKAMFVKVPDSALRNSELSGPLYIQTLILVVGLGMTLLLQYYQKNTSYEPARTLRPLSYAVATFNSGAIANTDKGFVQEHVFSPLRRMGYRRIGVEGKWDLLWTIDYPYEVITGLEYANDNIWINAIPGMDAVWGKISLSTAGLPFMPIAFHLVHQKEALISYAAKHKGTRFVEKNNSHGYNAIKSSREFYEEFNDSFAQEFLQRPLLVDGRKFKIGIYAVVTSVDPLRVYIYTGDMFMQFSTEEYHVYKAWSAGKHDSPSKYLPYWEVPSFAMQFERFGGGARNIFDSWLRMQNVNPSLIWNQMENIIRDTLYLREPAILCKLNTYAFRKFFEFLRFDFFITEKYRVFLLDVKNSTQFHSTGNEFEPVNLEQFVYSAMNLVGVARSVPSAPDVELGDMEMVTDYMNLVTDLNSCVAHNCDALACKNTECALCLVCMDEAKANILKDAHREHLNRGDMKRIVPKAIVDAQLYDIDKEVLNMSASNALMARWFYGKCEMEMSWC